MPKDIKASVIIPIKNGGKFFQKVLKRVLEQESNFDFEVVLVDSGSTDGTLEYVKSIAKKDKRIRIFTIKPEDFSHGKTRNYACSKARGSYFCFLTQDALPKDKNWLNNLIKAFKNDKEIAGVFGKHLPYKKTLPVEKQTIIDHFDIFIGDKWQKIKIKDKKDYKKNKGWYIFFSNNNSCIRRDIWEKYPFPNVYMAEDQNWAKLILERGFAKAYTPNATVYHSHYYSIKQIIKRFFDEYRSHLKMGTVKPASIFDAFKFYYSNYKRSCGVILRGKYNFLQRFRWLIFYLFYDLAKTIGFFVGTNSDRYKFLSKKFFSMQEDIKKQ